MTAVQHAATLRQASDHDGLGKALPERLGRRAIRSLYHEAALFPKPGLVSPVDNGSHSDMSMLTFYRSLFALRSYFPEITRLGATRPGLGALQALGRQAECNMLRATSGINTHRGAIFHLGLLCAAAGWLRRQGTSLTAAGLCRAVADFWGEEIRASGRAARVAAGLVSHGTDVYRRFAVGGARAEASAGFLTVLEVGLPAYRTALSVTGDTSRAGVHALFSLIARTEDSNLLWRGGTEGLRFARQCAHAYLRDGGALAAGWRDRAIAIHHRFVERRLSPGGSADLLAITLFLQRFDTDRSDA